MVEKVFIVQWLESRFLREPHFRSKNLISHVNISDIDVSNVDRCIRCLLSQTVMAW